MGLLTILYNNAMYRHRKQEQEREKQEREHEQQRRMAEMKVKPMDADSFARGLKYGLTSHSQKKGAAD